MKNQTESITDFGNFMGFWNDDSSDIHFALGFLLLSGKEICFCRGTAEKRKRFPHLVEKR